MAKKIPATPVLSRPGDAALVPFAAQLEKHMNPSRRLLWLWFSGILILGVIVLTVATAVAGNWLKHVKLTTNSSPSQASITTFNVQRTAPYAGLAFTVENAQYATSFAGDTIRTSPAVVRLNMRVANSSNDQISVVYYDIARLLVPKMSPIAPTNVHLSVGPKPGASDTGWLDFPVPNGIQLDALQLQLGSTSLGESLVTIPFTGSFNANRYQDRTVQQNLEIDYYFPYYSPQLLVYQLTSVDIRYAYLGSQAKAGQQFYVLNFHVNNPNGNKVSPGFGYDYMRVSYNDGPLHTPVDSTLPYGFNAGAQNVGGRVVFSGPAGLSSLTLDFLVQYGSGGTNYTVTL